MNTYYEYNHDVFRNKTVLCPCDDPCHSNFTRYFADNFSRLGLRRLFSTSYASGMTWNETRGRICMMTRDASVHADTPIIERDGYLDGNGD